MEKDGNLYFKQERAGVIKRQIWAPTIFVSSFIKMKMGQE